MPFAATWMQSEVILSEVSQTEKNKHHYITYMWNLILKTMEVNVFTKQKQTQRHRKEIYSYQRGNTEGYIKSLGLAYVYTTIYKIISKDLLYSTGSATQYSVITYMGKESEENGICICLTESLCCTRESNTTL